MNQALYADMNNKRKIKKKKKKSLRGDHQEPTVTLLLCGFYWDLGGKNGGGGSY
jgi:hypothetical protein